MSKSEFILLIPGILYGVALIDLLKVTRHGKRYWETIVWAILLFLVVISDWFKLYNFVDLISNDIFLFTLYIVSPLIFVQTCFILTPEEEDEDMKAYFLKHKKVFFLSIVAYMLSKIAIQQYVLDDGKLLFRIVGISLFIVSAFIDKIWVRTLPIALTLYAVYQSFIIQDW
jgi:hypothetical protein